MRLSLLFLLALLSAARPSFAQMNGKDLEGVTIKSKKLSVRDIIDSVYKNAPRNYAEPAAFSGTYTASYTRGGDTAFYTQVPVYLKKREDFAYGPLLWDSTDRGVIRDSIQSKAQWDRVSNINDRPFPCVTNIMAFMKSLDNISNTKRVLYASDQNETDPHFYLLFRPKGKISFPLLIRPFISSLDKDSLFAYSILKIRRKGWVVTGYEYALLVADPAMLENLISTGSFARAKSLIDTALAQPNLRRYKLSLEWQPAPDGRYRIHHTSHSDNLLNISLALFKAFPDPQGYIGTGEIIYDYEYEVPEVLQPFSLMNLLKDRKKY